jgi:hypothetical protein
MKCPICKTQLNRQEESAIFEENFCDNCLWELAPDVDTYFLTKMNQKEKEKNHEKE